MYLPYEYLHTRTRTPLLPTVHVGLPTMHYATIVWYIPT